MKINTALGDLHVDCQGSADLPTVVLWPSLFTDHTMWAEQLLLLGQRGWRTIALDPPGHGQSPGPGRVFTMDECAHAVIEVLDALGAHSPVVILGTSWGGFVAPRVASLSPDRVRAMLLFATTANRPTLFERMRARLLVKLFSLPALDRIIDGMIVSLMLSPASVTGRAHIARELKHRFRSWSRRGMTLSIQSVLVDRGEFLDQLSTIEVPTLLVSGADDHLLGGGHSARMAERLPHARHLDVPRVAHLIPWEAPEVANRLMLEFIDKLPR